MFLAKIYEIDDKYFDAMRFWQVFTKKNFFRRKFVQEGAAAKTKTFLHDYNYFRKNIREKGKEVGDFAKNFAKKEKFG
jgi:hypothetical protein